MAPLLLGSLIGGGISALGSIFGAKSAAKAQEQANATNLRIAQETNALNKQMFDESRGSTGSAVLPSYMKQYEASLGANAARGSNALLNYGGGTEGRLGQAYSNIGSYLPLMASGDNLLSGLYNGNVAAERRGYFAPVADARLAAAKNSADAIDQSIYGAVGNLDADAARRGFVGGSTFDRNRILMAQIGAKLAASKALNDARVANATDLRGIGESDVAMRFGNLDQPFNRAAQRNNLLYSPMDAESRTSSNAMAPLNFFRIGQNAFQYQRPDAQQPVANTGMVAGAGLSQIGSAIGNYYGTQGILDALKPQASAAANLPSADTLKFNFSMPGTR